MVFVGCCLGLLIVLIFFGALMFFDGFGVHRSEGHNTSCDNPLKKKLTVIIHNILACQKISLASTVYVHLYCNAS